MKILTQIEKTGKVGKRVLVKHVKMFPLMKRGIVKGFGKMKFTCLSMKLKAGKDVYTLTWSNARGPEGSYSFRNPDFMGPQYQHDSETGRIATKNGIKIIDPTKPEIKYRGNSVMWDSHEEMAVEMLKLAGKETTLRIIQLFADKINTVKAKQAAKAEEKLAA